MKNLLARLLGAIDFGQLDGASFLDIDVTPNLPRLDPIPPARYTEDEGGWCPHHEPMLEIEKRAAEVAKEYGYFQSAGGWIHTEDGRVFVDWLDFAD
jgi:hypothetical protein